MKKICILIMIVLMSCFLISTGWSETVRPTAPTNLTANPDSFAPKIKLTWTDNSDNESGFLIERNNAQIADVGKNVTSYTDTSLFGNTKYYYSVRAYNDAGFSKSSNDVSASITTIPNLPSYLEITAVSSSKVELTWVDNSDNETGFKIERKLAGGSYSQINTVGKNIITYTDTGLTSNTKYYYKVRAYNTKGDSKYCTETSVTTPATETIVKLVIGNTSYYINNQAKTMDTAPIIQGSRTLLPIKYVAEAIGAKVAWNNNERKVTITLNGTTIDLWIGMDNARINGEYKPIDSSNTGVTPIIVEPGRTMLPLRFISENLGAKVDWNSAKREITVTYPAP